MFTHSTKIDLPLGLCMSGRKDAQCRFPVGPITNVMVCKSVLRTIINGAVYQYWNLLIVFNVLLKCQCLPQKLLWPQFSEEVYLLNIKYLLHIYFETSGLIVDVYHSLWTVALHLVAVVFHAVPIHLFDWRPPGLFQPVIGCSALSSNIRVANLKFQKDLFSSFFL